MAAPVRVERHDDRASLIDATATALTDLVREIHAEPSSVARVVLTGGGAGIGLARALVDRDIDWSRVHVFFGDERNVPRDHPDSNEGQARAALLDHVAIPQSHIHGWGLDGGDMSAAVERYRALMREIAPTGFDVHLLGMGGEGHINSLFPHTLAVAEDVELAVAVVDSPKPPAQRATLTLPAVNSADHVWLLVSGEEKAEAAAHVAHGAQPVDWPAAGARGRRTTILHVTSDAATHL